MLDNKSSRGRRLCFPLWSVGRASGSVVVQASRLVCWWVCWGPDFFVCLSGPPGFACWIFVAPAFSFVYC